MPRPTPWSIFSARRAKRSVLQVNPQDCRDANGMGQWGFSSIMPKRYTSRELVKLAEEFGWMLVGVRGDHHNFKHPASRFIVTIVHPQKDVPVGRAADTVKKIRLEVK